jgi:two-component system OmpR family sensor kinase
MTWLARGTLLRVLAPLAAGVALAVALQVWQELACGRAARSLPGTGIGLALVRVIAARHEGRVTIRSREGQGSVVSIRLPAPGRARTAPAAAGLRQHRDTPGTTAG